MAGDGASEAQTTLLREPMVRGAVTIHGVPAKRSNSGGWRSASFIIGVEVAERFAYCGVSSNLISYLTGPMGQSTATAAENANAWYGTAMLLPLLGAFIADSFLGRYRTIIIASVIYILGFVCLSLSAVLRSTNSSYCKQTINASNYSDCSPHMFEVFVFFFSLYLIAFAQGGHKPCVQAFGADQFDDEDEKECKAKSSFFNWWYFSMTGGILVALVVVTYIQENLSWAVGFGIPCIAMCFALLVFLLGLRTYRFRTTNGERNPFARIGLVFITAARNWKALPPIEVEPQQCQTKFKFLDKALLSPDGSYQNICSVRDVEDAKILLRFIPIWASCLGYAIVSSQGCTLFTKQGASMDRYIAHGFQIPAAALLIFTGVPIVVLIPIYDLILVPIARVLTKKPAGISMLQRIGIGLLLCFFSMVIAALVEKKRLATAAKYGFVDKPNEMVPMSIWWLAPQYLLMGIADVFTVVGLQEFFYDQIPSELKSIGLALYLSIFGAGNFLSSLLISVIERGTSGDGCHSWFSNNLNRAHLDYFYWVLAGLCAVSMAAYAYSAKSYIYSKKREYWMNVCI